MSGELSKLSGDAPVAWRGEDGQLERHPFDVPPSTVCYALLAAFKKCEQALDPAFRIRRAASG